MTAMDPSIHVVEAAILRAAFIILGFMWGVIIVQNRECSSGEKLFGFALMAGFFAVGLWQAL